MSDFLYTLVTLLFAAARDGSGINADELKFSEQIITDTNINEVWNYIGLVAIGMSLIYFLLEMNRKLALEGADLNFKSFFAPFLKLAVALLLLLNLGKIVNILLDFNNAFIVGLSGKVKPDSSLEDLAAIADIIKKLGFMAAIGMLLPMLICFLAQKVLSVVWWYKAITYKIEVVFKIMLTPIACADIYSGQNSTAIRYLKKFIALAIYGASLVFLPALAMNIAMGELHAIAASTVTDAWEVFTIMLKVGVVAPFAALSAASVTKQLANEAMGC